jgi:glycerol-3-phosphate acyltransferase PlsX
VAVDADGGDIGVGAAVPGVLAALQGGCDCDVLLYGDQDAITAALADHGGGDAAVDVVACTQAIAMDESPAAAVRGKPDSPIVRAMRDHREGRVDAVISAGSTGAMVAASLLLLGRVGAAERPAIATFIPTVRGQTLLVDAGANTQATPELLVGFARMGAAYVQAMLDVATPTVGLLNIGGEPSKGSELAVATHAALRESGLTFTGNVEGNEVLVGPCDVLVTDGFTGNIALKLCEGLAQFVKALAGSGQLSPEELAGLGAFGAVIKSRFNYEVYGGAPLLGVDGVSIICHGRSTPLAFTHAVQVAERQVRLGLPELIDRALRGGASDEG